MLEEARVQSPQYDKPTVIFLKKTDANNGCAHSVIHPSNNTISTRSVHLQCSIKKRNPCLPLAAKSHLNPNTSAFQLSVIHSLQTDARSGDTLFANFRLEVGRICKWEKPSEVIKLYNRYQNVDSVELLNTLPLPIRNCSSRRAWGGGCCEPVSIRQHFRCGNWTSGRCIMSNSIPVVGRLYFQTSNFCDIAKKYCRCPMQAESGVWRTCE